MINAASIQTESQLEDLLTSLGFQSQPATSSDWLRCDFESTEAIGRTVNWLFVAVHRRAFYVLYYDEMDDMYAFWDLLEGDNPAEALREMILAAQSPAVIQREEANVCAILVSEKLADTLGQFVAQANLGWVWQYQINLVSEQLSQPIYEVETVYLPKEHLLREPGPELTVAPDLVIETIRPYPFCRWIGKPERIEAFFQSGVGRVWIADPTQEKVRVYRDAKNFIEVGKEDILRGEGSLAGFEAPVTEIMNVKVRVIRSYPTVRVRPRL